MLRGNRLCVCTCVRCVSEHSGVGGAGELFCIGLCKVGYFN